MNKDIKLGAIRKNVQGFDIREIVKLTKVQGPKRSKLINGEVKMIEGKSLPSRYLCTGKIALYAGKNLIQNTFEIANLKGMEKLEAMATDMVESKGALTGSRTRAAEEKRVKDKAASYKAHMAKVTPPKSKKKRGGKR